MPFWSSQKLKQRAQEEQIISTYNEDRIKHGSYELSLGPEVFVTLENTKRDLKDNEQLAIPPGQFCLLITEETIKVPNDAICFISIKAGIKFRGLVNISGFHVDPGFKGRLKFSVYNAGPTQIVLSRKDSVFLIWFSDLDRATDDPYDGDHLNQDRITAKDVMDIQGEVVSPIRLNQRLTLLEGEISLYKKLLVGLAVGLAILFFELLMDNNKESRVLLITREEERPINEPPQKMQQNAPSNSEKINEKIKKPKVPEPSKTINRNPVPPNTSKAPK